MRNGWRTVGSSCSFNRLTRTPHNHPQHLPGAVESCRLKSAGRLPRQASVSLCRSLRDHYFPKRGKKMKRKKENLDPVLEGPGATMRLINWGGMSVVYNSYS